MKESDKLKAIADAEDNDLKYMGLMNKSIRAKRSESFEETWLEKLRECVIVEEIANGYLIHTESYGKIDYFPKANKICIRTQKSKWIKPELRWLITKIINNGKR